MPGAVYLEGEAAVLRTIEEDDLPFLRDVINDPEVRRFLPSRPPLNLDDERAFYENEVVGNDDTLNLLIWAQDAATETGERRVGTIGLRTLSSVDGSSEIGLFLAPDAWGEGLGTEASRLVTDWAFDARDRHRVTAQVLAGNEASARVWEKLGFRHEATFREADFLDGEYVDRHLYAVLEDEWREGDA